LRVLINEELVSLFIGKEGKNIKKLMDTYKTNVTVHREKNDTKFRPVEIEGSVNDIIDTVMEINRSMEFYI
jgi:predicted PilT family ATPase